MLLIGVDGARECKAGRWNNPKSRSLIFFWAFRDVPLKRKKSTGGLFLGTDQVIKELLPFVTVSVAEVGGLAVFGKE